MTIRNQRTTGEMISTIVFAGGGLLLIGAAFDPAHGRLERLAMGLGGLGGLAAAARFLIAALWARWR